MMKPRSWIKTMAASALLSPRAAFRKANSSPRTTGTAAPSMTSIPLPMIATLTRVVQFLDENHLEEEGLYSKPGVDVECKDLLVFSRRHELPDLSAYNAHSIASVVKQILSELYKPLIPTGISEQLIEAVSSGRVDKEAGCVITETFKQIRSTTRDFLQIFLCHLNHVSESGPNRMSVTNLALHVGIALIRPTEDRAMMNSKAMVRRRKCVAEFLIRHASSLPYDCATELNIPAIPELISTPTVSNDSSSPKQLHFVQVTLDAGESKLTPERLEEMFVKFGEIENLGINDQGNRAIIAYVSVASAKEAERASIPTVRVRRRKPRQSEKSDYSSHSPKRPRSISNPSLLQNDFTGASTLSGTGANTTAEENLATQSILDLLESRAVRIIQDDTQSRMPRLEKKTPASIEKMANSFDNTIIIEDIEEDQAHNQQEHQGSELHTQTRADNVSMIAVDHDDGTALLTEPTRTSILELVESQPERRIKDIHQTEQTELSISELLTISSKSKASESENTAKNSRQIDDAKQPSDQLEVSIKPSIFPGGKSSTEAEATNEVLGIAMISPPPTTSQNESHSFKQSKPSMVIKQADEKFHQESRFEPSATRNTVGVRTLPLKPPTISTENTQHGSQIIYTDNNQQEQAIGSMEGKLAPDESSRSTTNVAPSSKDTGHTAIDSTETASLEALQSKLLDMEKILSTSTAALSTTKLSTEFERAVLQLHKQILEMVAECLMLAGAGGGEVSEQSTTGSTTNNEFLDFLEAQAKTQVKILEVEVRAGQELLRLHKTQNEKERIEIEEEITALRVSRTETERFCAELHTHLRKCRSELACHVANAADIQRQKSALGEKLATTENQLYAKDVALTKLQEQYDKMTAEAQSRVDRFKLGDYDDTEACVDNQSSHSDLSHFKNSGRRLINVGVDTNLPYTMKFLTKHPACGSDGIDTILQEEAQPNTPAISVRPSNVAALEAMKQQMSRDIQEQLASTKAALREMEVCSPTGKSLEEEEGELRRLQQLLASRSSEMDAAMNESRSRLQELLSPTTGLASSGVHPGYQELEPNLEPTIFDSTALVNELIARADWDPTYDSNQQRIGKTAPEESFLSASSPKPCRGIGTGRVGAQFYQPAQEDQSVLYKKWTAERSRKMAQLASYRDQQAVLLAQQSMQTFQQTLAEVRKKR